VLEALIHAGEQDRVPAKRVEGAMAHQQRAKARFLPGAPPSGAWREVVGCDEHQAIAQAMAEFL
jgi:hypothetical protein